MSKSNPRVTGEPWETAPRSKLERWVREAAMASWLDDYNSWKDLRWREDGWSAETCRYFLKSFAGEILRAKTHLEGWLNAEVD